MLPGDQPAERAKLDQPADVPHPGHPLGPPHPLLLPPRVPQLAHRGEAAGEGGQGQEQTHRPPAIRSGFLYVKFSRLT